MNCSRMVPNTMKTIDSCRFRGTPDKYHTRKLSHNNGQQHSTIENAEMPSALMPMNQDTITKSLVSFWFHRVICCLFVERIDVCFYYLSILTSLASGQTTPPKDNGPRNSERLFEELPKINTTITLNCSANKYIFK